MKLLKLSRILFVLVAWCLNITVATVEDSEAGQTAKVELLENFRTSKNIMFSCLFGGSSHVNWVLTILKELSDRGHSAFFLTRDDHARFSNTYESINTSSIGPAYSANRTSVVEKLRSNFVEGLREMLMTKTIVMVEEFAAIKNFMISEDIDIAICDTYNVACIEASKSLRIPFVLTATGALGADARAPYVNDILFSPSSATIEHMSFKDRLSTKIIRPIQFLVVLRDIIYESNQNYRKLAITAPKNQDEQWKYSYKLVNSAFGFEAARPIGPLMELIGPILPRSHSPLDGKINSFLSLRSKVAYVAFGQQGFATKSDCRLLMTALLESLEANYIDGIIWGVKDVKQMFPKYITTLSNTTYDIHSFAGTEKGSFIDVMLMEWAPQMAILLHSSVSFFVTHCGAGSMYEAMYAGKRVVAYPFVFDQPYIAHAVEQNGIGIRLDIKSSQEHANEVVKLVARDTNGVFQANTNRFKALVQIRSKYGTIRGADAVEEVLFTHKEGGKIPHRYPSSRNMSFVKANNYDIYLFLIVSLVVLGYALLVLFRCFTTKVYTSKFKTL